MRPCCPLPLALALVCLLRCAAGAGVFELQILEFSNYRLELASGACCGGAPSVPAPPAPPAPCARPCRTRFALCLKEYQSVAAPGACSFGRADSPALGTDSFTLAEPLYTLALPFSFRWTRSFTLVLQAFDDAEYPSPEGALIEEAWWSGIVEPGAAWHALRWGGARAALAYRVRVTCQPNYYNTTCTTFCRPRDDKFGHYACDPQGSKRCLPGWQGDNCEKPVCKEGCHPTHGRCDEPGDCDCRPGWRGALCAQCQPYPGCKHGYCNGSSWDCTCDTNWGGILCDQDLNYCGTHEPCQHGGTCENTAPDQYLCRCADGFSGVDCQRVDNPCAPQPCKHGACALEGDGAGFSCACERGWGGALCDTDLDDCAGDPCRHGATCRDRLDAFACDCAPGWTGATCEDDVDECVAEGATPCVNAAACNNTQGGFACTCLPGWTGRVCDVNVDDCASSPCLHGATCIDLVDDFHCACAAGYAGRTCALDVDECASAPCRNGGECQDLPDAYRCICPVGFSGTNCELSSCSGRYCPDDRDHCASSPCGNGAACYTAQSDYYCHCAPGWQGKDCTQRTLPPSLPSPPSPPSPPAPCLGGAACVHGRCLRVPLAPPRCACDPGYTGALCDEQAVECADAPCRNNGTCIDGTAGFACVCRDGWTGKTCSVVAEGAESCGCSHGGTCVRGRCVCAPGWSGVRCETPREPCGGTCRHGGRCERGAAGQWGCVCGAGWRGPRCEEAACEEACAPPAACVRARCLCPAAPPLSARRCLESLAGLSSSEGGSEEDSPESSGAEERADADAEQGGGSGRSCGADGAGAWWWGCNACRCERGAAVCTRLWCGVPDCLAPGAAPCRSDEVCVPAAPALCLRAPCAAPGECRRVSGRSVSPPALPAPPSCWPGAGSGAAGPGCARARLQLSRARLGAGSHVERACASLRRALAAALAPRAPRVPPLALLCDLAPDDEDALDLALWIGPEVGGPEDEESAGVELAGAVRELGELVARRRLAHHALLGAARSLRVLPAAGAPPSPASAAAPAAPGSSASSVAWLAAGGACAAAACAAGAWLALRRRRVRAARALRDTRCDEEKSNNLQNEENLRRYANPLHEGGGGGGGGGGSGAVELRAHSLYKAQNADARNDTPPRDKELTMRALPPPEPPPARPPPPHPHQQPERLTVLV